MKDVTVVGEAPEIDEIKRVVQPSDWALDEQSLAD